MSGSGKSLSFSRLVAEYASWAWSRTVGRQQRARELQAALGGLLGATRLDAVDVGAALGAPTHWEWLQGQAHLHLVEPRGDAAEHLRDMYASTPWAERFHLHQAAVSGKVGTTTLHVSNAPTGSSLFELDLDLPLDAALYLDRDYLYPLRKMDIETATLGALLDGAGSPGAHMIKLDVQGAELDVLRGLGARKTTDLVSVETEAGLHGLYRGGCDFSELNGWLADRGLELYDVRVARTYLPSQAGAPDVQGVLRVVPNSPTVAAKVWEFDAIFFRRRSDVLARRDGALLRRLLAAYATYNFYAEAVYLCSQASAQGIISTDEAQNLARLLVLVHRLKSLRPWYLDSPINRVLLRMGDRLSPRNSTRWCQHTFQQYPNG